MLVLRISLIAYGDHFSPKKLMPFLGEHCIVVDSNEPTDRKWADKSEKYEFGAIAILHPWKVGYNDKLNDYQKWYIDFIEKYYDSFVQSGAEEFELLFEAFYNKQCNFSVFDKNNLKRLAPFDVAIVTSVYKLANKRIKEILQDAGQSVQ